MRRATTIFPIRLFYSLCQKIYRGHGGTWSLMQSYRCDLCSDFRETGDCGEGWLTVELETEANGYSKSTKEPGLSLVCSLGSLCQYKRFFSCLGCCSRPSTRYFLPLRKLFQFVCPYCPSPSKLPGSLAVSLVS
jgi:hypothetical protein